MVGILKVNVYLHYKDLSLGQLSYVSGKICNSTIEVDSHITFMDACAKLLPKTRDLMLLSCKFLESWFWVGYWF